MKNNPFNVPEVFEPYSIPPASSLDGEVSAEHGGSGDGPTESSSIEDVTIEIG